LDYLGSTCPRLILEGQRTNLALYSEQLDNAEWSKVRCTITANNAVSPDGYTNADRITDTTFTADSAAIDRYVIAVVGTTYTFSAFLKAGTAPFMYVGLYDGAQFNAIINASTGAITFTTAGATSTVTAYANGWYRLSITRTITASVSTYPYIGVCQLSNSIFYNGTGAYTAQIWGAQYEASAYPTSYIPTLAASATRGADACSKTGISSLIGQTEGVIFLDFVYTQLDSNGLIPITIGTDSSNVAYIFIDGSNKITFDFVVAGTPTGRIQTAVGYAVKGTRYKFAFAYKANDFAAYINGQLIGTDSSGAIAAFSNFYLGYPYAAGYSTPNTVNQALVFKTRLTNAELAELTTL
jgi:hypothetical protein